MLRYYMCNLEIY